MQDGDGRPIPGAREQEERARCWAGVWPTFSVSRSRVDLGLLSRIDILTHTTSTLIQSTQSQSVDIVEKSREKWQKAFNRNVINKWESQLHVARPQGETP